jgi:hypothetical protein
MRGFGRVCIGLRKRVARSLIILLDKTDRPILPQYIALRFLRAPKRISDTRRARMALRTVEPERRARTASETSKGRRRYARWGILLARSNLSPTAMASARSQRVSLAETSQDMSEDQLSRRRAGCSAREGGATRDAAGSARVGQLSHSRGTHSEPGPSLFASRFPLVMRARPQR